MLTYADICVRMYTGMPVPGKPLFELRSQAMAVPPVKYKKPDDADDAPMGGLQVPLTEP